MYLKLGLVTAALVLSACASPSRVENWTNFSKDAPQEVSVAQDQGVLVVYRDPAATKGVVRLSVDGEYFTSLLPGGYSQTVVCARTANLGAAYPEEDGNFVSKTQQTGYKIPVKAREATYIRISEKADGSISVAHLPFDDAVPELKKMNFQTNLVSRVGKFDCSGAKAVSETRYVLDAEVLFAFDGASAQDISAQGKKELARLAGEIKRQKNIDSVQVVGHTDPKGSAAYNQKLSEKRAQTVGRLLVNQGIAADAIFVAGMGKEQPVVADCEKRHKDRKAQNDCNRPNRRVEIIVQGFR